MGITYIKIRNFKSIKKMDYNLSRGKVNCMLGKNGVGKTTIDRAITYFYELASNQYAMMDIIDKKNPYVQKASIELCFDFSNLLERREHNVYIDNDIKEFEPYIIEQQLVIKLTQYKTGKIEWYPVNDRFKVVKILKIFPVYMIQTRKVDVKDWTELWNIVTDIAITGIKESKTAIWERLKEDFEQIYGDKYVKVLNAVDQVMKNEKVSVNEKDFKKRFKNALMTNIGGEIFMYDDQSIDFYSDGINSLKYLSLSINLLSELSSLAWKEIMVILDEPETSLHLQYIEELANVIVGATNKISFILATHSTRLISTLLRESSKKFPIVCNQIYLKNGYTYIRTIQDIISDKDKYLMRDNEAESYFANAIVFVEGQTEIQLLKNKNIASLFPKLKKATIYNTESDDSATKLIRPKYNNPTIPFLVLLDMDKVLAYSKVKSKFYLKKGNRAVNPLANKNVQENEKYLYYGAKKIVTYKQRKYIEQEIKKRIIVDKKNYYNMSHWYDKLIESIKKYCKAYRTIIFRTTVEGAIICEENIEIVYEWLNVFWKPKKCSEYLAEISILDKKVQVSITRGIFHGKTDYLLEFSKSSVPSNIKQIIDKYSGGKKTDGWILDFFDWYFEKYMNGTIKEKEYKFSNDFPEIFEVVKYVNDMIE